MNDSYIKDFSLVKTKNLDEYYKIIDFITFDHHLYQKFTARWNNRNNTQVIKFKKLTKSQKQLLQDKFECKIVNKRDLIEI